MPILEADERRAIEAVHGIQRRAIEQARGPFGLLLGLKPGEIDEQQQNNDALQRLLNRDAGGAALNDEAKEASPTAAAAGAAEIEWTFEEALLACAHAQLEVELIWRAASSMPMLRVSGGPQGAHAEKGAGAAGDKARWLAEKSLGATLVRHDPRVGPARACPRGEFDASAERVHADGLNLSARVARVDGEFCFAVEVSDRGGSNAKTISLSEVEKGVPPGLAFVAHMVNRARPKASGPLDFLREALRV